MAKELVTKILFIDSDETSFQVRRCMANVLHELPPVELFHAHDATEALAMMEDVKPDVVVIDDEAPEERNLFLDSLPGDHPPILLQTDLPGNSKPVLPTKRVTCVPRNQSLAGIHQTLLMASALGAKKSVDNTSDAVH